MAVDSIIMSCFKLCAVALGYREYIKVGIEVFNSTCLLDKIQGGLFAYALYTRDIIGSIAHQRLDLYHLAG